MIRKIAIYKLSPSFKERNTVQIFYKVFNIQFIFLILIVKQLKSQILFRPKIGNPLIWQALGDN